MYVCMSYVYRVSRVMCHVQFVMLRVSCIMYHVSFHDSCFMLPVVCFILEEMDTLMKGSDVTLAFDG